MKTHKPVFPKPADFNGTTLDRNNERKFAFLSQETVPDYRTMDVSAFHLLLLRGCFLMMLILYCLSLEA